MKVMDYMLELSKLPIPNDCIRYIYSFSEMFIKEKCNTHYLDNIISKTYENGFNIYMADLPYENIWDVNNISRYLNEYCIRNSLRVSYTHYTYSEGHRFKTICFYPKKKHYKYMRKDLGL